MQVDFLCIGAQKGGTTWLNEQLLRHSDVCLPPVKEVHYFNYLDCEADRDWIPDHYERPAREFMKQAIATYDPIDWRRVGYFAEILQRLHDGQVDASWYDLVFRECGDRECVKGDITPAYLRLSSAGIQRVYDHNPKARLIAMLREPVARSISAARMMLKRQKLASPSDDQWRSVLKGYGVINKSQYGPQLQNWMARFPRDQLLVLPFEMIGHIPGKVADCVCDFLQISRFAPDDVLSEAVHVGKRYEVPSWVVERLEAQLAPARQDVISMFPEFGQWWSNQE